MTISIAGAPGLVAALIRSIAGAITWYTRREAAALRGVPFHEDG
ncbi:hypothetical protein [Streptomyces sp. MBT55]|nr:hypothetical protein [Streptomyces sp. MBT55]